VSAHEPIELGCPDQVRDLVLIHGWGMNGAVWEALASALPASLRLHPIELPGHGERTLRPPCNGGSGTLEAWADACLESAPRRAVWLGWSLGGLVALAAALRTQTEGTQAEGTQAEGTPERIQGLILMTATPRFVQAPDWPAAMRPQTLTQFHDGLLADPAGTLSRFLALQVRGSDQAREALRRLRHDLATRPPPDPSALALGLDLLREQDLRPALSRLRVPSIWLFGSHDTLVPAAVASEIPRLLPGARARIHTIAGAAHAPFLSHPTEIGETIGAFLEGLTQVQPPFMGSDRENLNRDRASNQPVPSEAT